MTTRDFDAQRTAALAALEPIAFTLFGREWVCQPMPTPAALMHVQAITETSNTQQTLYAGLSFVGACVEDADAWDAALKGAVIDGDTLLDLITWLAGEYQARYSEAGPTITPPTVDQSQVLDFIAKAGGRVG